MIKIESQSYQINKNQILDNITLEIPKQSMTILIGTNGAGKSTLLSLISQLTTIQTGKINIDDDITINKKNQQ